jgi:RNA recognition motif-containing protein
MQKEYFTGYPEESVRVTDLSYFCTEDHLISLFSEVGDVIGALVCRGRRRKPLYYGYVHMANPLLARQVIERFNKHLLLGRELK